MYFFMKAGTMLPLDDLLAMEDYDSGKTLEESLVPGLTDLWKFNGASYMVPNQIFTSGIFYDQHMFDNLGIKEIPKTWDEMLKLCEIFKENGIPPFGQDGGISGYNAWWFTWFTIRIAGKNAFFEAASDPTAEKWNNPEFLEAAKWVEKLVKEDYFIKDFDAFIFPEGQAAWEQGQAAMFLNGSWVPPFLISPPDTFDVKIMPFPNIEGGKGNDSVEVGNMVWGIPKGSKNPEAAKEFIRFGMQKIYQKGLMDLLCVPARNDMDLSLASPKIAGFIEMLKNAKQVHLYQDGAKGKLSEWWTTTFINFSQALIFGEITAEEFINQIKKDQVKFYSK
jgi:raffinose/stachyose/melibiose transport system substrate-binding protein